MSKRIAWQTWLMMLWPYSLVPTILIMSRLTTEVALLILGVWVLLTLVVCGLTLWGAVAAKENGAWQGMLTKLVHIPFYIGTFFLACLAVAAPPLLIGLFLLDGLLMLTTSSWGLLSALRAWRQGKLPPLLTLLLLAGHCIFVLDVACSILLWLRLRKNP